MSRPHRNVNRPGTTPRRSKAERWILSYTLCAALSYLVWIACMLISGRTLLWHSDSYLQQYTTLRYTAEAVRRLLSGQGFRMVDFSLGQGLDVLASLGFYGLTNPCYWIAALFTGRALEVYYHVLIILYSWLEGLTFGLYVRRVRIDGNKGWLTVAGSLMFAFCGYNTNGMMKCPYFAAGGIFLCLMLYAVERTWQDRKWMLLSVATLLAVICNFYLGYQTLVMAAIYTLLRLAYRLRERGLKRTAADGLTILLPCVLGLLLSSFMLLPTLSAFLSCGRVSGVAGYSSVLHYTLSYYKQIAACMFVPYSQAGHWTQLAFLPWTAVGLAALFVCRGSRRRNWLKLGFVLALAAVCVPLVGKLLNGNNYVSNRWCYGYAFVACACATAGLREVFRVRFSYRRRVCVAIAAYAAVMIAVACTGLEDTFKVTKLFGIPMNLLTVGVAAVLLAFTALVVAWFDRQGAAAAKRASRIVCVTTALCCFVYTMGYGAMMFGSDMFMKQNLDGKINRSVEAAAARVGDGDGFSRVDTGNSGDEHATLLGYSGTGYYWSIIPSSVCRYYIDLQATTMRWTFRLEGLGADPYLEATAAVGSAVRADKDEVPLLPYGFEATPEPGVFKNALALPMGLFFDETLPEERYRALSPLQKREALLSAAVLEGASDTFSSALSEGTICPVTVARGDEAVSENAVSGKKGDIISISCDIPEDSIGWLWIQQPALPAIRDTEYRRYSTRASGGAGGFYVANPRATYYYDQDGVFLYLGQGSAGAETLEIRFPANDTLAWEAMDVVAIPVSDLEERVEALRDGRTWSPDTLADNRIAGTYDAPTAGVLQLSVPWLPGWSARVNGAPVKVLRCGGMYSGIELSQGHNDIELTYETPWLRAGVCVSCGALVLLLIAGLVTARRNRRSSEG